MYREILLNSDNYARGDPNHPFFTFPEDIRFTHFCVRTCEFPNFYFNMAEIEVIGIITYNTNGTIKESKYVLVDKQDFPTVQSIVNMLNGTATTGLLSNTSGGATAFTNTPVFEVINTYFIGLSTNFGFPWAFDFSGTVLTAGTLNNGQVLTYPNAQVPLPSGLSLSSCNYPAKYLRRLLSFPNSVVVTPQLNGTIVDDQIIGAIKCTRDNYLLLRSSSMSGSMLPNTTSSGAYSIANVICKIPVNQGVFPYGTYVFYENNDSPSRENMFEYNGGQANSFDLYFTRPNPLMYDDIVDFQGWNFSVTLGIMTSETP